MYCASNNKGTEANFCLSCFGILTKTGINSDDSVWIVLTNSPVVC